MILKSFLTKRRGWISLLFLLLFCSANHGQAQKKNLVWREDFGVAGDSVRMDFADPMHTMPGH
ncbi:MAG: hypothetical protein J6Y37_10095, partial [Paludibacteraceae bacterium]|nr:hypothetical protein [Paludibacteraceae bacterium]